MQIGEVTEEQISEAAWTAYKIEENKRTEK